MDNLIFCPVTLTNRKDIFKYTSAFGEGSCQHSPVSMYSLSHKYGDKVCMENGFLYILRSNLEDDSFRVYMAPLGSGDLKAAYERILDDAHSHGKKASFITLTEKHALFLKEAFPERFDVQNDRDLAEYIYSVQNMAEFPGKKHARRRTEIRSFWRDFGDRTEVRLINNSDIDEILAFAEMWLSKNAESHDEEALNREMICIKKQLNNFDELGLSGTVIRIDGRIMAFCYGSPLNDEYYDVLIEKGDRGFPGIYRVLRQESTKLNLNGFKYINFEEDLGVEGLRKVKESYIPEFMIDKYKVREL